MITVTNTLEYIRDIVKPDMLLWTGDNSPHDRELGEVAVYEAQECLNWVAKQINETFPDLINDTFSVIGNHDVFPHWDFNSLDKGNPAAN